MIITKKAIPRRTVLRGLGATLALPFLDGMVPALKAIGDTTAKPVQRFGVVYVPHGAMMPSWTPKTEGAGFEMSRILKPLEPVRDRMLVISGLASTPPPLKPGEGNANHCRASTRFLTDIAPKPGGEIRAGTSIDQMLAKKFGSETQLASLEVGIETVESAGACEPGYGCAYTSTISWQGPNTPLPMENSPRVVFERLFGDGGTTDPAVMRARMEDRRSILDSVLETTSNLQRDLGATDRGKLDEYLDSVRDAERRIENAERQGLQELPAYGVPTSAPATFAEHVKLMFDLQVLAYQADLTRVITFMMAREFSGRQYSEIGVPDAHHPISHHAGDPVKIEGLTKISTYHAEMVAYYLDKLQATRDGAGSLLDHMTLIYGSGMGDSNTHDPLNLPVVLLSSQFKGNRHLKYPKGTPLANFHLTLLDKFGVSLDALGDSRGRLEVSLA